DLVKFIEKRERKPVYTAIEDEIGEGTEVVFSSLASSIDAAQYRKKVMQLLEEHREHPAVLKVRFNEPLAPEDLHSLEALLHRLDEGGGDRVRLLLGQESLAAFIRRLVGLDREAAQRAFGHHLAESRYNSAQIRFIDQIVDHLTRNGVMDPGLLYEQPFTDFHPDGLDGLFPDSDADRIVRIIAAINENVGLSGR
ncbi:MAG: restriction endonuclease subunit, partial [Armatimonadetes bacterium]|nr:restriction endonuclease subunit [Armatimonadota bacterium]